MLENGGGIKLKRSERLIWLLSAFFNFAIQIVTITGITVQVLAVSVTLINNKYIFVIYLKIYELSTTKLVQK